MPSPLKITINSKTYLIPILNNEMDCVVQDIELNREELRRNTERRINNLENLENLNNTLLLMYIQQTGSYPS